MGTSVILRKLRQGDSEFEASLKEIARRTLTLREKKEKERKKKGGMRKNGRKGKWFEKIYSNREKS